MSYILDALQKSERERRIGQQVPSLESEALEPSEPSSRSWIVILIVVLVVLNVITLAFFSYSKQEPPKVAIQSQATISPKNLDGGQALDREHPAKVTEPNIPSAPKIDTRPAQPTTSSDSHTRSLKNQPQKVTKKSANNREMNTPRAEVTRQSVSKKPIPAPLEQPIQMTETPKGHTVAKKSRPESPEKIDNKRFTSSKAADLPTKQPKKPEKSRPDAREYKDKTPDDSIPMLKNMPRQFQRELPELNINVFVYSENPKERFVVINMVKYTSGEKLTNGPLINEIRSNSIVMEYQGQRFRIQRP